MVVLQSGSTASISAPGDGCITNGGILFKERTSRRAPNCSKRLAGRIKLVVEDLVVVGADVAVAIKIRAWIKPRFTN